MTSPRRSGLRRPVTLAVAASAIALFAVSPLGSAGAAQQPAEAGVYLVQFTRAPIAGYTGGVDGIAATKPVPGAKLDRKAWNFNAYRQFLRAERAEVLRKAKVDGKKPLANYDTVVNGVALKLTAAEVTKLRNTAGVAKLWKREAVKLDTVSTPRFLGLDGASGAWARQFGDVSHAGEGVVVGVVDTGVWPESPSFAPLPEPRPDADAIAAKWSGECAPGDPKPGEAPFVCNNKLIGARVYDFGSVPVGDDEFHTTRDADGHGSHTASTAAGNNNVPAIINGVEVGRASGMAPAARVAAYKICYHTPSGGFCGNLESVAAIDDAVADGVDVINYSISGSRNSVTDLVEKAFFHAAAAGVFVSASAGNSGPEASTVAHNDPWVTTVAASTHDRASTKSVTLGNGATYTGAGLGPAVPSAPLIDSATAGKAGADPAQAELCFLDTLDPAKVTGKIVLCKRGVNARVDKSQAVKNAGGVGMVLYNPSPNSLNADFHFVPTVHVDTPSGTAIKAYIAGTASPTASLSAAVAVTARAPQMAAFSSLGPALAGSGDLLKPDITAPGVDVIAAFSPVHSAGNLFNAISGTSMSSPHIAGIGALLKSKNPGWSPMAIKSAIMTTATTQDNTGAPIQRGTADASPLDFGAGHVRPANAFDPGLVYESTPLEWVQYACGIGQHQVIDGTDVCPISGEIDPSDLNYASIAVGDLAGKQTITRTVSNATNRASVYFAKVVAPAGYSVKVTPSTLTVLPRRSATYTVEITRTGAALDSFAFGSLTWADLRGHSVRSPIAVRAATLAAPSEVSIPVGVSGAQALSVRPGFGGTLTATPFGLAEAAVSTKTLVGTTLTFDPAAPAEGPAVGKFTVTVPAGTKLARFATFDADHVEGSDLDVFVYRGGTLVGSSTGGSAEEAVTVTEAGTYDIFVAQLTAPGVTEQAAKLNTFAVSSGAPSHLTATPASQHAVSGKATTVTAAWSGLVAGKRYLGLIEYGNGGAAVDSTVLSIQA